MVCNLHFPTGTTYFKIEVKVSSSSFIPTTVSGVNCDSHNVRNSDQSAFFKFHLGTPIGSGLLVGF